MAAVIIPLTADATRPLMRMRVRLDARDYLLDIAWNARAAGWYLDVYTPDERPVVTSARLIANTPIAIASPDWAGGRLGLIDPAALGVDPQLDTLGQYALVYVDAADVQRLTEAAPVASDTTIDDLIFDTPVALAANILLGATEVRPVSAFPDDEYLVRITNTATGTSEVVYAVGFTSIPYDRILLASPTAAAYSAGAATVAKVAS